MSNFYTLLTRVGAALHANAQVNQTTVPWTHMRLGDGNGAAVVPAENQTGLVRQVHTLQITDIAVHPDNPNWVIAEAVVPSDVGGWTVRETAIYGGVDGNTCIAVGNYPETYKPALTEGAGREMVMRMVVQISSVATVKLQIDPAVAIASRAWVESLVATPAKAGLVKFANLQEHLDGETSSKAATPAGVHALVGIATEQVMEEVLLNRARIAALESPRTWKTVTASRAQNTVYWNLTDAEMDVHVFIGDPGPIIVSKGLYVDGDLKCGIYADFAVPPQAGQVTALTLTATVPAGGNYSLDISDNTIIFWKEFSK